MKVAPVISIHIPFGGDNHRDIALATEAAQTVSGVATIASLMQQLASAGLQDQVTLMSLNVFGRTSGTEQYRRATAQQNHQVSVTIGKPFRGGVVGAIGPVGPDYGALPIASASGAGSAGGDIVAGDTLAAFGQTMLAAIGADPSGISSATGKVVASALA